MEWTLLILMVVMLATMQSPAVLCGSSSKSKPSKSKVSRTTPETKPEGKSGYEYGGQGYDSSSGGGYGSSDGYEKGHSNMVYYGGHYGGGCSKDGVYHNGEYSFVTCNHGIAYVQRCAPGTKNSMKNLRPGGYYKFTSFCDINLVDFGYAAYYSRRKGHGGNSYSSSGGGGYDPYGQSGYGGSSGGGSSGYGGGYSSSASSKGKSYKGTSTGYGGSSGHGSSGYGGGSSGYGGASSGYGGASSGYGSSGYGGGSSGYGGSGYIQYPSHSGGTQIYGGSYSSGGRGYSSKGDTKNTYSAQPVYTYSRPTYQKPKTYSQPSYQQPKTYSQQTYSQPKTYSQPSYQKPKTYTQTKAYGGGYSSYKPRYQTYTYAK